MPYITFYTQYLLSLKNIKRKRICNLIISSSTFFIFHNNKVFILPTLLMKYDRSKINYITKYSCGTR